MSGRASTDDVAEGAGELESLTRFLNFQRGTILAKAEGVARGDALQSTVPSGTSLLGIVKHLTHVERFWFRDVFAGRAIEYPWTEDDPDADWRIEDDETVAEILAGYREAIAESAVCCGGSAPNDLSSDGRRRYALRWFLLHMIEETARHAGHADIIREQMDGTTGF